MKSKDQKKLEALYESISNQEPQLLEKEKEFIDILAKSIMDGMYKNLAELYTNTRFYGSERLSSIVHSTFLNPILNNIFEVSNDVLSSLHWVYDRAIVHLLYNYIVTVRGVDKPQFVCFKTVDSLNSKIPNSDKIIEVPIENKDEVLKMFKKTIGELIVFYYKSHIVDDEDSSQFRWYKWRENKLKYSNLENNLPELKGIF